MADARTYADPPSLPPPPRAADFHAGARLFRRAAIVSVLAVSAVCLVFLAMALRRAWAIDDARTATARVLSREVRRGGRHTSYVVRYRFTGPDGREVDAERSVKGEQYDALMGGEEVPVAYLPSDPASDSWLFDDRQEREDSRRSVMAFAFPLGMLWALLALGDWHKRRERDLARRGEVTRGRITEAGVSVGGKGAKSYWIRYEFKPWDGATLGGRAVVSQAYYEASACPDASVGVLWDPTRPRRHVPLPALRYVGFPSGGTGPPA